ncbi:MULTISPECIES: hypothetical protein [Streptomyces]|nr:hypothetical protein [Streptomyces kasugaensis]
MSDTADEQAEQQAADALAQWHIEEARCAAAAAADAAAKVAALRGESQ